MATGAKAAIVTGAASGLGRAMALGLADSGIDVVAVDQNAAALGALATAMAGSLAGSRADADRADLTDRCSANRADLTGA
jgi:NADP-dependent 3-hydroxy acid dehydrogenase YdfG